jgi:hypothetical protein
MRIVVTLATLLALPCGLYAGDDSPGADVAAIVPAATAQGDCDTSVYHLEHARAGQLIDRVRNLVAQVAAYAADEDVAALPKSLVLLPTTSDDAIVAICPRAHAAFVKHAIKSCDASKQYAIKVQLFEVADNGQTVPVGGPHLLIGRSGNVQCATDDEAVSVNFKVDVLGSASSNACILAHPTDPETAGVEAGAACATAGRCRLDCPPPIGEMAVDAECGAGSEACSASETCATCKEGECCHGACSGTAACKCNAACDETNESDFKSDETTNYEETLMEYPASRFGNRFSVGFGFDAGAGGLHFAGPLVCFNKGDEPRCVGCACPNCECQAGECGMASCQAAGHESAKSGAVRENLNITITSQGESATELPFILGLLQQFSTSPHKSAGHTSCACGTEAKCTQCGGCSHESQSEVADSDDGHEGDAVNGVPPAPAEKATTGPHILFFKASSQVGSANEGYDYTPAPNVTLTMPVIAPLSIQMQGWPAGNCSGPASKALHSSCTDGQPFSASSVDEAPGTAAPCSCEEAEEIQQAPAAEPPALLTLLQHKYPSSGLPANPHWQEELVKAFRGRRLSELFEPQPGQTPADHALGRLVAEFPKQGALSGHGEAHSLTIVDTPDRVRIFETNVPIEPEKLSQTAKTSIINTCPNCREEFRAFLEEMFRRPEDCEDIAQTSHHESDRKATESARDLPNVTHSKISTEAVCYPLRDLVLCDDAGRPVFDTCSIIDHLQAAVAPESWSHPSVSIQLDQQSVSLVITQTAEVHQKIADHLRYLRRLQIKQICNLIERLSGDTDEAAGPSTQSEPATPSSDVELGLGLPVGGK